MGVNASAASEQRPRPGPGLRARSGTKAGDGHVQAPRATARRSGRTPGSTSVTLEGRRSRRSPTRTPRLFHGTDQPRRHGQVRTWPSTSSSRAAPGYRARSLQRAVFRSEPRAREIKSRIASRLGFPTNWRSGSDGAPAATVTAPTCRPGRPAPGPHRRRRGRRDGPWLPPTRTATATPRRSGRQPARVRTANAGHGRPRGGARRCSPSAIVQVSAHIGPGQRPPVAARCAGFASSGRATAPTGPELLRPPAGFTQGVHEPASMPSPAIHRGQWHHT